MGDSQEEILQELQRALGILERVRESNPEIGNKAIDIYAACFYVPDKRLEGYIEKLKLFLQLKNPSPKEKRDSGYLLEQIVLLSFCSLKGFTSVKSFQSPGPQYDLIISGDNPDWEAICKYLYIDFSKRGIIIESKAINQPVKDQQFALLCSVMELNLCNTVGLGVFFTLNGATGFPKENESRQRKISDARLRQLLFYAKTQKPIVILDKNDIFKLKDKGSLLKILALKIRDLSEFSGLYISPCEEPIEVDLPEHLNQFLY